MKSTPESEAAYREALLLAKSTGIPFLVGGAAAFKRYTGIDRDTKDIDLFTRQADCERMLQAFAGMGYETEMTFAHWLGKIYVGEYMIDVIFSSGNGIATVDDVWFERSTPDEVCEVPVDLIPPEEMIWSKAFVMERERYDGADVMHVMHAHAEDLDWTHLLERFGSHWRVLLSYVIQFGFVYPNERTRIPSWVVKELTGRLHAELDTTTNGAPVCRGTLLSREQYRPDFEEWGYRDARLKPEGRMSAEDIAAWTAAIDEHD